MASEAASGPVGWQAVALTIVPDMYPGPIGHSLAGQALTRGDWSLDVIDIRDFGIGKHRKVDDSPAGGGPGMVMRADVAAAAIDVARARHPGLETYYLSPRGRVFDQRMARELAAGPGVILLAGRFEGLDERVIEARGLIEVSIGDYVLSGGDLAAMVMVDTVVRLLPGVMGTEASGSEESFEAGLLEYPHYTRPRDFEGRPIPDALLSGDHQRIARWRADEALRLTRERRPDLLKRR